MATDASKGTSGRPHPESHCRGKIAKHIIVKKPGSKVRPKREDTVPLPDPKRSRTAPASAVKQEVKQEESRPEGDGGGLAGLLGTFSLLIPLRLHA